MNALRTIVTCLILAVIAVGCDNSTPTEQSTEAIGSPSFAADQNWIYDSYYHDDVIEVACAGEDMHRFGEVPFRWHQVTSQSGVYNYHFQLLNWAQSPPFVAVGQTTGRRFVFKAGPYNESFHAGPGEVIQFRIGERYVADKGNWFTGTAILHITVNANGALAVSKWVPDEFSCHFKN
ncbi:MAG: hypothetical protein PVJ64_16020 [Gemmatimonadales bacterium]|jgi:hypothetical protein